VPRVEGVDAQSGGEQGEPYQKGGEPTHRADRINDSALSIVAQFQKEFRGIAEYYRLAYNLYLLKRL
jgi:hypothetical protein